MRKMLVVMTLVVATSLPAFAADNVVTIRSSPQTASDAQFTAAQLAFGFILQLASKGASVRSIVTTVDSLIDRNNHIEYVIQLAPGFELSAKEFAELRPYLIAGITAFMATSFTFQMKALAPEDQHPIQGALEGGVSALVLHAALEGSVAWARQERPWIHHKTSYLFICLSVIGHIILGAYPHLVS